MKQMNKLLTFLLSLTFMFLFSSSVNGEDDSGLCIGKCMVIESYDDKDLLKDIFFEFNNYDLSDNAKSILKKNVAYLKSNPSLKIEIQGHCDERGTNNYNTALGERRAQSTKQYLVSQGVNSSNVHVVSFGEEKPFCFESGESCWYKNRRAHFMVSK